MEPTVPVEISPGRKFVNNSAKFPAITSFPHRTGRGNLHPRFGQTIRIHPAEGEGICPKFLGDGRQKNSGRVRLERKKITGRENLFYRVVVSAGGAAEAGASTTGACSGEDRAFFCKARAGFFSAGSGMGAPAGRGPRLKSLI